MDSNKRKSNEVADSSGVKCSKLIEKIYKMTTFFTVVEQNAEKPGPSGQKFSKPPLEELDEALEVLSDEEVNKLSKN